MYQVLAEFDDVRGDEIVGILLQFVFRQQAGDPVYGARAQSKHQYAANQLEHAVDTLDDDTDLIDFIEQVARVEPFHGGYSDLASGDSDFCLSPASPSVFSAGCSPSLASPSAASSPSVSSPSSAGVSSSASPAAASLAAAMALGS